jgi:uncharacterized protein YebE (UPF0316 family)
MPDLNTFVFIPLLIFFSRITDVTLGTIRIIMISRSNRLMASLLGFFEVIIWLVAISQVLQNLHGIMSYIAYGAGFAAGNYVGISLENRLALGMQAVQVITEENLKTLTMILREEGFAVTNLKASGQKGELDFLFVVTPRKRARQVLNIVREFDSNAFVSVTDLRSIHAGYYSSGRRRNLFGTKTVAKKK